MTAITDEHKAFARDMVDVARKHNMDNLTVEFRFGWGHPKDKHQIHYGEVKMTFEEPREGATKVHLCATERHNEIIDR